MTSPEKTPQSGDVPLSQVCGDVPVFDCHVILSAPDSNGRRRARAAALPGIEAEGATERDLLRSITQAFKACVQQHVADNTPIPWKQPPDKAGPGETERWLPVHL